MLLPPPPPPPLPNLFIVLAFPSTHLCTHLHSRTPVTSPPSGSHGCSHHRGPREPAQPPRMTGSFFYHLLTCIAMERERGRVDGTAVRTWFWLHTIHTLHIPVQCESDKSENIHACKTCTHFPRILASLVLEIIPSWLYASSMHLQVRDILHVSTQHAYRQ